MRRQEVEVRLTSYIRQRILKAVITARFEKDEEDLKKREKDLAKAVFVWKYTKKERDLIDSLPESFLPLADGIEVNCGIRLDLEFDTPIRVPFEGWSNYHGLRVSVPSSAKSLHSRLHKFAGATSRLAFEKKRLTFSTRATLDSFSTDTALVKAWPEIKPFIPKSPPKKNLPAVVLQSLIKDLRLG